MSSQLSAAARVTTESATASILQKAASGQIRSFASAGPGAANRLQVVGLRRENKNRWERRVPLLPQHVARLIAETGTKVLVQPSTKRVVPDEAYLKAGATITEDLSQADIILGIKEVPIDKLIPNKTFMVFSHTHKGQDYNMPTLKAITDNNIRLLDYELLVDPNSKKRLVMFGKYAGYAGMIDCLHGLGQRLLGLGYNSPFIHVGMAHTYSSLQAAKDSIAAVGAIIREHGLPTDFAPFVFVFTGSGNVSQGAQEVFRSLPHQYVTPDELPALINTPPDKRPADFNRKVYAVEVNAPDYIVHNEAGSPYDRSEYRSHPERYRSVFFEKIAPYATTIINGLFWSTEFPRLMTNDQLRQFQSDPANRHRLLSLMDISCDIGGSFEFMTYASTIGDPFFYVDASAPGSPRQHKDVEQPGIQVNSVDNLPTELPYEASLTFADALYPFVKAMALGNFSDPIIANARITEFGQGLLEPHKHLQRKIDRALRTDSTTESRQRALVIGSGRVAAPLIEYLYNFPNIDIHTASNQVEEAQLLASRFAPDRVSFSKITDVGPGSAELDALVKRSDVVISLVPATLHPAIAQCAIQNGKNMVTASYISPEMQALDKLAKDASVTILNEIGLDPGIDHCSAMQMIERLKAKGHELTSFISFCGGLVTPENSDNPLGYKFSWFPRGVLTAGLNPAQFKLRNRVVKIANNQLLKSYFPNIPIYKGFAMEGLANRDSLGYADVYGLNLDKLDTMLRGTLRYRGYSELMEAFRCLGFLDSDPRKPVRVSSYPEFLEQMLGLPVGRFNDSGGTGGLLAVVARRIHANPTDPIVGRVMAALGEFGMLGAALSSNAVHEAIDAPSPLDAFCTILQRSLALTNRDRDMVCMVHEFGTLTPKGTHEIYRSSLVEYGQPNGGTTAMSRTVGVPAAIAAHMLLTHKVKTKGVIRPTLKEIYDPLLDTLSTLGITFSEQRLASHAAAIKSSI